MPMVDTRPCSEVTHVSPVFMSMKQPVPYVFLVHPGVKQQCPNSDACWSPATPVMGGPYVMISFETLP